MSSTSELLGFAARLRESILASDSGARILSRSNPRGSGADFEALALELFALQFEHNRAYRRLCEARGARPDTIAHWADLPAAPTSAFKEFDVSCLPVADRTAVFHSSGTTGQKPSRHFHNASSLALYEAYLLRWFDAHFQLGASDGASGKTKPGRGDEMANGKWQMAILTPPLLQAPHSSLVHMFETLRRELGSSGSRFVGRVTEDGTWALELEAAVEVLRKASQEGQRLLILGTAFSFVHLLDHLAEQELWFELPPGSCALETGGYKGRSRSMPKAALHALIAERLGIPRGQIVCEYGMSELSSQAYDCAIAFALRRGGDGSSPEETTGLHDMGTSRPHPDSRAQSKSECRGILSRLPSLAPRSTLHAPRSFHFPPWSRVQIVSPETGREVGEGETGLIRVFDLANVYSVMAIQTEDLGIRRGTGFALVGRAVLAEPRGCSLMAV